MTAWENAANIATTIGVIVALIGVVVSSVLTIRSERLTRRGQQLELAQAEATAQRSEAAASLTEEYTRRVVEALESMATRQLAPGAAAVAPARVRWAMTHHGGDTYLLTNTGDRKALNVTLSSHETLRLYEGDEPRDLGPDEAMTFMAAVSLGTADRTITVHWEDEAGNEREWRYPLPARPRR